MECTLRAKYQIGFAAPVGCRFLNRAAWRRFSFAGNQNDKMLPQPSKRQRDEQQRRRHERDIRR
jgi:hypothetical protein